MPQMHTYLQIWYVCVHTCMRVYVLHVNVFHYGQLSWLVNFHKHNYNIILHYITPIYITIDVYLQNGCGLQPQSMSLQMPILLRTGHWHILLPVWSLWSWRQSCWPVAKLRYCFGHFGGTPWCTLSWSGLGCRSHNKEGNWMQKQIPRCCLRPNLQLSKPVKWHND